MFNYRSRTTTNGSSQPGRDGGRLSQPAQSIGSLLRERREAIGASLAEVEAATKIRQKYLSAIESDEWQLLPGEIIGRGFLRNYANYLGVEANEVVERRRAIVDPGLATALVNTSAGAKLPPAREVDYRPREMDLRDDSQEEEQQQIRLAPYLRAVLALLLVALLSWSLFQYRQQVGEQTVALFQGVSSRLQSAFAPAPTPSATPTLRPTATPILMPTAQPGQESNIASGGQTQSDTAAVVQLPTPTNTPDTPPTPTPELPTPSPTPVILLATVNTNANLRAGPGTDFAIAGGLQPGQQIQIRGRTADGQWFLLDNNQWVFAQLVANPPADAPVAAAQPTPEATATSASGEQPIAPPTQSVVAASCPNPDAVLSSPGENQLVAGVVTVTGTANRQPFAYYKIEVNGVAVAQEQTEIAGGELGRFDSAGFGNGAATVVLTSVDQSGNYSQCATNIVIQN
jgi:cytoskeletal protein RodZ